MGGNADVGAAATVVITAKVVMPVVEFMIQFHVSSAKVMMPVPIMVLTV